ncbi:MAG TPA: FtsX-like permease family protein, partial [Acidimicrobiales bacterium]
DADAHQTLKAIGMTRGQLWTAVMIRTGAIALVATAIAVAGAVAASAAFPFGRGRLAEPTLGIAFDPVILLTGAGIIVVMLLLLAAGPAWRAAKVHSVDRNAGIELTGRGRLSDAFALLGASPAAVIGVRMATQPGQRRHAVPVRAAIVGAGCSLAALTLAFSFGAGLDRLFTTPHLYGWNWDAIYGNPYGDDIADQAPVLATRPEVNGFSTVAFTEVEVNGRRTAAVAFDPIKGDLVPPVVEGRAPRQADEIVLGKTDLAASGRRIGQTVTVAVGDERRQMRIVGRGVLPAIGRSEVGGLGDGVLLSAAGLGELAPDIPSNLLVVRFAAGTEPRARLATVRDALGGANVNATAEQLPVELADYDRIDRTPMVLAALLAVIATATLAHALVATVSRRRRELAILKTLGFVQGQVRSTVAWQATTMVTVALVAGLPIGLIAGRWVWRVFAEGLGTVSDPVTPWTALALTIAAAVLVTNFIAAIPGRRAARTQPAAVLRSE